MENNVTLIVAIISLLLSVSSWMKDFVTQRKNVNGRILGIKSFKSVTYVDLMVENRSRIPVSITDIHLEYGGKTYHCAQMPKFIHETSRHSGNVTFDRHVKYSTQLPVFLSNLGSAPMTVLFENMEELPPDDATHLNFLISTNRGRPVRKKLELPAGWDTQRDKP